MPIIASARGDLSTGISKNPGPFRLKREGTSYALVVMPPSTTSRWPFT